MNTMNLSEEHARHDNAGRIPRTIGYYVAFVALGSAMALLGPTLQGLARHTQTQLHEISLLFTVNSLGYLVGSFQGGRLYDRLRGHPVMVAALVIMAVMLALVPLMPSLWLLAAVMLVLGLAEGTLDVGGNTLLVWVHGSKVGPFMNGLHFFWGLGAFLAPIVVARATSASGDIAWAYWVLGLAMLPAAAWLWCLPGPAVQAASERASAGKVNYALVALSAVLLFLYVGAEVGFGGWIFTYAVGLGLTDEAMAAYLTSGFWGAYTVSRLLSIPIAARFSPRAILLVDLVGCLISMGVILLWPASLTAVWAGALGVGASMASIFPTVISLGERHTTMTGQVMGWFFLGASVGGMVLPWLMGQLFEPVGPRVTMLAIAVDLVLAVVAFIALASCLARPVVNDE
jgi:FHS family Na+ dependent glucose MFS transporter 1